MTHLVDLNVALQKNMQMQSKQVLKLNFLNKHKQIPNYTILLKFIIDI